MTEYGVKQQLKRLEGAYKPPSGDGQLILDTWMDVLDDVTDTELAEAVTAYLKGSSPYHPRPGQLRRMVMEQRGPSSTGGSGPGLFDPETQACTCCGAVPEWLTPDGQRLPETWDAAKRAKATTRLWYKHDPEKHAQAGVPMIGLPPQWRPR